MYLDEVSFKEPELNEFPVTKEQATMMLEDSRYLSRINQFNLFGEKFALFQRLTLPSCIMNCASRSYLFTGNSDFGSKEACVFNCSVKYDLATDFCSSIVSNHPVALSLKSKAKLSFEEDSKLESLINKHF